MNALDKLQLDTVQEVSECQLDDKGVIVSPKKD